MRVACGVRERVQEKLSFERQLTISHQTPPHALPSVNHRLVMGSQFCNTEDVEMKGETKVGGRGGAIVSHVMEFEIYPVGQRTLNIFCCPFHPQIF